MTGALAADTKTRPVRRGRRPAGMPKGRQVLLEAAIQAFAAGSYDSADLRSIAAAAGVSPNLVRVHFGSKAELWDACLQALVARATPVIARIGEIAGEPGRPLLARLRDTIEFLAGFYAAHPEVRNFVVQHLAGPKKRAGRIAELLLKPAYLGTRELIREGIAAGHVRASHPVLFFVLLSNALSPPPSFPSLIRQLAPELGPARARKELTATIIDSFIQETHAP